MQYILNLFTVREFNSDKMYILMYSRFLLTEFLYSALWIIPKFLDLKRISKVFKIMRNENTVKCIQAFTCG